MQVLNKFFRTFTAIVLTALSVLSLMACGKGFQSATAPTSADGNNNGAGATPTPAPANPLDDLIYKGRPVSGGTLAGQGQLVLEIDRANEALVLILPIPVEIMPFLGPITEMSFPELPGAKIKPYDKQLAVSIPLKHIVRGGQFRDPKFNNLLPNGDRLPALPAGEGARFSLAINNGYLVNVYLAAGAVAVFLETPDWDKFLNCQGLPICPPFGPFEIRNEAKTEVLGYVALIAAKLTFHSGVYVASKLSEELTRFLDDHLKY